MASVTTTRNEDGTFVIAAGDQKFFEKLPAQTASNLAHEILRLAGDKCPCHRETPKQSWSNMDGRWQVEGRSR